MANWIGWSEPFDSSLEEAIHFNIYALESSKAQILHLPQVHRATPQGIPFVTAFLTASSQYMNLRVIEAVTAKNIDLVFIDEGQYTSLTAESAQSSATVAKLMDYVKKIFPKGVPNKFSGLSVDQLQFIESFGAARTAFFLGLVSQVHGDGSGLGRALVGRESCEDITTSGEQDLKDKYPLCHKVRYQDREDLAITMAETQMKSNPGSRVLINYGLAHDFGPEFQKKKSISFSRLPHDQARPIFNEMAKKPSACDNCSLIFIEHVGEFKGLLDSFEREFGLNEKGLVQGQ